MELSPSKVRWNCVPLPRKRRLSETHRCDGSEKPNYSNNYHFGFLTLCLCVHCLVPSLSSERIPTPNRFSKAVCQSPRGGAYETLYAGICRAGNADRGNDSYGKRFGRWHWPERRLRWSEPAP